MEQQGSVLDGNLETLGLQATLKMLALGGKTGMLSVAAEQERLQIALQNGHILALEEPDIAPPDLIEIFRLLARITRDDAVQLRQMAGANPVTAMVLMAQRRLMAPEEVQKRLEFGVVQALSRAVRWERGRFEFHRDIAPIQARVGFYKPLNVDHVLLEALRIADERDHEGRGLALSRYAVSRWIPQFQGDVAQLGLSHDEVNALCLANGQIPLYAIAYGLLLPETTIVGILQRLLDLGLIEIVDTQHENNLQHDLMNLLTQSQYQFEHGGRVSPDQRMLQLIHTMTFCTNGLLDHHAKYARALRRGGEVSPMAALRYIESTFAPVVATAQRMFPRMDEIIRLEDGHIATSDIDGLSKVVRGQELVECYRDAMLLLSEIMHLVFERVLGDEAGQSRPGRQYEDIWATFSRELDTEIARLLGSPASVHA